MVQAMTGILPYIFEWQQIYCLSSSGLRQKVDRCTDPEIPSGLLISSLTLIEREPVFEPSGLDASTHPLGR